MFLKSEKYTLEYHLHAFKQIAEGLKGYTKTVVISFIDLYPKASEADIIRLIGKRPGR